jgi:cytoskeletal protein RodZ
LTVNLEALSLHLKAERLRQGLSRGDVARKSDLSISVLLALEVGEFSEIGPPSLVHAFLLSYSQALGIGQPRLPDMPVSRQAVEVTNPLEPSPETFTRTFALRARDLRASTFSVAGIVALGVLFGLGWVFWGP